MNKNDRELLQFLLTSDTEEIHEWYEQASEEQILQAMVLMAEDYDQMNIALKKIKNSTHSAPSMLQ